MGHQPLHNSSTHIERTAHPAPTTQPADSDHPATDTDIIDLVPETDASGEEVFVPEDILLRDGVLTDTHREGRGVSVLPSQRMAADKSWNQVAEELRAAEEGTQRRDVVMNPGGQMEVVTDGIARPASRLPQQRMAGKPYVTFADLDELKRLDTDNTEDWTPVYTASLDGWKFRLRPHPDGETFVFVTFRSPHESGKWRLWVLHPNMDDRFGHEPHMVNITLDGQVIPVICGAPGAAPANSLAEARTMAGKWAVYTQRKLLGQDPVFSK